MLLKEETGLNVLPFGLLELSTDSTILYYRPAKTVVEVGLAGRMLK